MKLVTYCYMNEEKPIVFEDVVSDEDRKQMEVANPGVVFKWEIKEV